MNGRCACQALLLILLDSFVSVWFSLCSSGPAKLAAEIRGSESRRRRW
jgi:hypothetical protein